MLALLRLPRRERPLSGTTEERSQDDKREKGELGRNQKRGLVFVAVDSKVRLDLILEPDLLGREHFREFGRHIRVLKSPDKVRKHLLSELIRAVYRSALGPLPELVTDSIIQVLSLWVVSG